MAFPIIHNIIQPDVNLSDYAKSLSDSDKQRYAEKLKVKSPNGTVIILDDPYIFDRWSEDVTLWPDVQYGNIYNYLIESPGSYTTECLKHYRSLEAYKYVLSGKVQKVLVHQHQSLRILTAEVQPSQRTGIPNYKPWVLVYADGVVETAHCNCVAGLGETCSHIAALLFKIERAVNFGYTKGAPTDEICRWNNNFKKKISPSKMSNLDFSKPKWETENKKIIGSRKELAVAEMTADEIEKLRSIQPDAVFFTLIDASTDENDMAENQSIKVPATLTDIAQKMTHKSMSDEEIFLCSFFNDQNCQAIEMTTRGQAKNDLWFSQRCGRITASRFGEIFKRKTWSEDFIHSFSNPGEEIHAEALKWGRDHENCAFKAYETYMKQHHANFEIHKCGLFVPKEAPYLGASPDAAVTCSCCKEGILEIKCPYKHRHVSPKTAALTDSQFYLNTNLKLKENHNYFYQVQGQLLITKRKYCDFIVWTPAGFIICRIYRNEEMTKKIFEEMKQFFFECVLPKLKNK